MPNMYTLVAPCFFGTEHTLSFEVKRLGAQNVKVTDGRVAFEGDAAMIAAANLNLRTAERVLLLLKTFPAATFDELFDGVYSIPWEELIPVDAQFPVKGSSLSSQLSSVPACQSIVKKAIVKRLQYGHKTTTLPETGALYKIRFALRKNVVEVMLDTSGDGLHKRGYRKNATLAPIKETLAATIADVGFVRRDSTVQDPFCGSGTLVIEAAQKALNIAPGLRRRFAAEHYDFVPAAVWAEERQKALAASRLDAGFEGFGFDIDPNAVALANANAKLAGGGDRCRFEVADVKDFAPRPSSIILTNPPYGERLGDAAEAAALARTLGQVWQASPTAGLYAITADADFEAHFGKKAAKRRKIYNGMIPCQIYMYFDRPVKPVRSEAAMQDLKLAVLIDADNISPKYVKVILDEAASFGVAACKRIYGDWSDARLKSWKDVLLNNSIIPIQQYSYTTGKNATDSAMIIDAMDLLYAGNVDGFCIVSSDSDFTRLAARLREAGKLVIGMGESKALGPFVKACDQFKYLDLILEHGGSEDASADSTAAAEAAAQVGAGDDTAINRDSICRLVCDMIDEMDDGTGWVRTSRVGDQLIKRYPDFDVRNFGSKSLNKFLASFPVLEVEERTLPNGNPIQFVRVHPQPKKGCPKKQNQPRKAAPKRRVPRNKKSS